MIREAAALNYLISVQNEDGGWGYLPGSSSTVEPTSASILALRDNESATGPYREATQWLLRVQHEDGGWGLSAGDGQSAWQTAWAVLVLENVSGAEQAVALGREWLLNADRIDFSADDIQRIQQELSIDPTLEGWPWLPGEGTWIEPTALALLALAGAPPTADVQSRLDQGVRYLLDRRCPVGGWNVGNPVMFGKPLPPRTHPTALVLLALMQLAPAHIRDQDIDMLRRDMRDDGGVLSLALGTLVLKMTGNDDETSIVQLDKLQASDGGFNQNAYHTAVAALASRGYL